MRKLCSFLIFMSFVLTVNGKTYVIDDVDSISNRISVYLPCSNVKDRTGVIIFPGGGYHTLVKDREGEKLAKEFNKLGIVSFVLNYSLPSPSSISTSTPYAGLIDSQSAIKYIRANSVKFGVDPGKIGVMGFSAGGHLAATVGTHFNFPLIANSENTNLRPDFMILVYPIISFIDSITHLGSKRNLLGETPTPALEYFFSNELHVNSETPITFITHALDDTVVKAENSQLFYDSLKKSGVSAYFKQYSKGEHGFLQDPKFEDWFNEVLEWMKASNLYLPIRDSDC